MADKPKEYRATRALLYIMAFVSIFYYGAHLIIPTKMLRLFDLEIPPLLLYVQILGGIGLAAGIGLFMAARDPAKNAALIAFVVIGDGIMALLFAGYLMQGRLPQAEWFDVALLGGFTVLLPALYLSKK